MWKKCRVLGQKHRTSLRQTSVLLGQNIGTLWQRSPMFSFFRPENAVKSRNIPHFPILRYLDPRQVVVDSEALLSPLTMGGGRLEAAVKRRRKNIAHSSHCRGTKSYFWGEILVAGWYNVCVVSFLESTLLPAHTTIRHRKSALGRGRFPVSDAIICALSGYYSLLSDFIASRMKSRKRGCGWSTVLEYSGWNCAPMYQRSSGISTISTRFDSGFRPTQCMPADS